LAATAFGYDWSLGAKSLEGSALQLVGNRTSSVAMAFFLVLPAVFGQHEGRFVRRLLASHTLTWLGIVSYGMYLWHVPLITWIAVPLKDALPTAVSQHPAMLSLILGTAALVLTLVAASFSYYIVELPFLRYKEVTLRSLLRRRPLAKPA
jgi:peptidoglycan/LPS O-acetylase OafA/YrhL